MFDVCERASESLPSVPHSAEGSFCSLRRVAVLFCEDIPLADVIRRDGKGRRAARETSIPDIANEAPGHP